jgi:hypothetical protein
MSKRGPSSHLRLISSKSEKVDKPIEKNELSNEFKQLELPYNESSSIFLVHIDIINPSNFLRFFESFSPKWFFDIRTVPRLDTIALSRSQAFDLFDRTDTKYVDVFGRLDIKSYLDVDSNPLFWSEKLSLIFGTGNSLGPYFFLFDDFRLMKTAEEFLPETLSNITGLQTRLSSFDDMENELVAL